MKNFLKNLINPKNRPKVASYVGKRGDCHMHNSILLPHVLANEYCQSCHSQQCYICSKRHLELRCDVDWTHNFSKKSIMQASSEKNELLNQGYLAIVNLTNLMCVCGQPIEKGENPGLCAACATATCSSHCHDVHIRDKELCLFHTNFTRPLEPKTDMRSLLLKNVRYLQNKQMAVGTPIAKSSSNFLQGFLGPSKEQLYLQRGFRQYGQPSEQTLANIEVINEINIDYVLHLDRRCSCQCTICKHKDYHPTFNCQLNCKNIEGLVFSGVADDERLQQQCMCKCSFCSSGLTVFQHNKLDCIFNCKNSSYSQQK